MTESEFEEELRLLLDEWDQLDLYTARLRSRLDEVGAVTTAQEYVRRDTAGLGEAFRRLSPRQTLEGLILRHSELFDDESSSLARTKLDALARQHESDA